jgi:hypothetical protein
VAVYVSEYCILREETCERKKRKLQRVCCRLYPFICWIIIKEGLEISLVDVAHIG